MHKNVDRNEPNYLPDYGYTIENPNHYVFAKPIVNEDMTEIKNAIAYTVVEQKLMKMFPKNAREGLKLAKAVRLSSLLLPKHVAKLSDDVRNIQLRPFRPVQKAAAFSFAF